MNMWVGTDEHHGVPSQARVDVLPPPHWRLDAVAGLGRPHHLALSTDKTELAFVLDSGDASDIWAMGVSGVRLRRLTTDRTPNAYWDDTPPAWSSDGRQIAYVHDGWIYLVPSVGGPPQRLIEGGSPRWIDHQTMIVSIDRDRVTRLCRLSVDDPWPVAITPNDGHANSVALSPDRTSLAYIHSPREDRGRTDLRLVNLADNSVTTVVSEAGTFVSSPVFGGRDDSVVFAWDRSGRSELYVVENGLQRQITTDDADFAATAWSDSGPTILAVRTSAGISDLVTIDEVSGEVIVLAPGGVWSDPDWTQPGHVAALYEDHRTPPSVMTVYVGGETEVAFASIPASIEVAPCVSPEPVSFPSFDGLSIPAFLFRPVGSGRRPVVVYPHGGPTSHYGDEWDGHAQYFLDKGYGWLAINFRGSTSYGRAFEHAEHGSWGVADTEDCLAAHDYLATLDWVDPTRIAIFGASYGSYLALAALARDPRHRYACGVAKYGDCDILTSWAQGDQVGIEDLERMMGHPSDNRSAYRDGSPVHWVADIDRPLLIAHGGRDVRVSPKQSEQLVKALTAHDKTFEYLTYPTEGHGLLRRAPQVHFYERLERFLDWYLM